MSAQVISLRANQNDTFITLGHRWSQNWSKQVNLANWVTLKWIFSFVPLQVLQKHPIKLVSITDDSICFSVETPAVKLSRCEQVLRDENAWLKKFSHALECFVIRRCALIKPQPIANWDRWNWAKEVHKAAKQISATQEWHSHQSSTI